MTYLTATTTTGEPGPLTRKVEEWSVAMTGDAAADGACHIDWAKVESYVDTAKFKRVGAYLEELDWAAYKRFMTEWAGATRFEMTVFQVSEIGRLVVQEIEERHWHGEGKDEQFIRKNVVAIYRFDDAGRIIHLDIYEQARDSGQWIIAAARAAEEA